MPTSHMFGAGGTVPVASAKENQMTSRKTKIAALTALLSLGALGATYAATDAASRVIGQPYSDAGIRGSGRWVTVW